MSAKFIIQLNALASRWAGYAGESLLSGMLALALAWGLSRLFHRRLAPWVVCLLWLLVLVRVAVPFTVSVVVPEHVAVVIPHADGPLPEMDEDSMEASVLTVTGAVNAAAVSRDSVLFLLWGIVVLVGMAWLFCTVKRTWRIVREARPVLPGEIPVDVNAIASSVGLRRTVRVKISPEVTSPAVAGLWFPVLLLPEGLPGKLTSGQWRWTLAHELMHLRRGDLWVQVYQTLMKVLFFFHPAVWLAGRELDARREQLCDAGARTLTKVPPQECAEGFLTLLEMAGSRRATPLAAAGMSGGHRRARVRLQQLLAGVTPVARRFTPWAALIIAALLLLPGFRAVRAEKTEGSVIASPRPRVRENTGAVPAGGRDRIQQLESRVAELEKQVQDKSKAETRRENARAAARRRAAQDEFSYTADQLHEMEMIYQAARQEPSFGEVAAAMQPLFDRFPGTNRAGCAALYIARNCQGEERESWLQYAIDHGSDCQFLDGTSAGGLARVLLAADRLAAGQTASAARLLAEVRTSYPESIDFDGTPLVELAEKLVPSR